MKPDDESAFEEWFTREVVPLISRIDAEESVGGFRECWTAACAHRDKQKDKAHE